MGKNNEQKPKEKIMAILNQFGQEEIGNRLSQFALLSLRSLIQEQLNKIVKKEGGEKNA